MNKERLFELVEQAQTGDKNAFIELYSAKAREILYKSTRIMGNRQDGEDVAQEVIVKLYQNIARLKEPHLFSAWLNTIITNECNMLIRKKIVRKNQVNIDDFENSLAEERMEFLPQEFLEDAEKKQALLDAIETLPNKRKNAIMMYYYDEMSYAEIALATGTSVGTVSTNIMRARQSLQKELSKRLGTGVKSAPGLAAVPVLKKVLDENATDLFPGPYMRGFIERTNDMLQTAAESGPAIAAAVLGAQFLTTTASAQGAGIKLAASIAAITAVAVVAVTAALGVSQTGSPLISSISGGGEFPQRSDSPGMEGILEIDEATLPPKGGVAGTSAAPADGTPAGDGETGGTNEPDAESAQVGAGQATGCLISGQVYLETGTGEAGEGLDGAVIELYQADRMGQPYMAAQTGTVNGVAGNYIFFGLPGGSYRVKVTLPPGAAFPAGGRGLRVESGNTAWLADCILDETKREIKGLSAPALAATTLGGAVEFLDINGAAAPDGAAYVNGMAVSLLAQDGAVLQTTQVINGAYRFAPIAQATTKQYTIQLGTPASGLAFAQETPGGQIALMVKPVSGSTDSANLYVTDKDTPRGDIALSGGECACGHLNPKAAQITYVDATAATMDWRVADSAGNSVSTGNGANLDLAAFRAAHPAGWYTIVAQLHDAAGNTTIVSAEFESKI